MLQGDSCVKTLWKITSQRLMQSPDLAGIKKEFDKMTFTQPGVFRVVAAAHTKI